MKVITGDTAGALWLMTLQELYHGGGYVSPRGKPIREHVGLTLQLTDIRANMFNHPIRNPSYRFAVAEWLWIWFGRDDVASIAQYNKHIVQFSDDGETFSGAYGPPFVRQYHVVLDLLKRDPDSRQAVIVIFRRNEIDVTTFKDPAGKHKYIGSHSKDVPCTLTMQYFIRKGKLETIVSMRSSDVWLGLPYDIYNFTQLANILAGELQVTPGSLILHLGSSHLYETNVEVALDVLKSPITTDIVSPTLPGRPPSWMENTLVTRLMPLRIQYPWEGYARVLLSQTNKEAAKELTCIPQLV